MARMTPPPGSRACIPRVVASRESSPDCLIRAPRLGPGQGPCREPPMVGEVVEAIGEGGLRMGRSSRGEHRCYEG